MAKKKKQRKQIPPGAMNNTSKREQDQKASHLSIALQEAVPLRIYALYERGGPTSLDIERSQKFGRTLAANGDKLLFRSSKEGETAQLFNQLAEAIAVTSYNVGGTPKIFDQSYEASQILSGFIGPSQAARLLPEGVEDIAGDEGYREMRKRLMHLQTIDVQQRKENFPEPVAWVWLQVDRMTLPDNSLLILKETLSVAQVWGKSWARCEVWTGMCWQEMWRLEDGDLYSVRIFQGKGIRAGEDTAVFEQKEIKRAVLCDIQSVRMIALCILSPQFFQR